VRALEVDVGGVLLAQRIDLRLPARLGRLDRRLLASALDPDRRLALRVAAVALGGDGCLLRRRALRRLLRDGLAARLADLVPGELLDAPTLGGDLLLARLADRRQLRGREELARVAGLALDRARPATDAEVTGLRRRVVVRERRPSP
jgi:hypothetical protein